MKKDHKNKREELDTETTFANMNVEGFSWYRPKGSEDMPQLTPEEKKAMMKGVFATMLPALVAVAVGMLIVFGLMYLWLM